MTGDSSTVVGRLRNDEYTGANRCTPCTAVNVIIAVGVSAPLAIVSPLFGAVVFALAMGAIYFRGYLVPGTPTLTKRYLPDSVLARFDKGPERFGADAGDEYEFETAKKIEYRKKHSVDPEEFLVDVGAVEPGGDDERRLTDEFASLVDEHVERVEADGVDVDDIVVMFDEDPDRIQFKDRDHPAIRVVRRVREWPAEGALVTDVGTDRALRELTDRWAAVPLEQRLEMLESLRLFKKTCPACGGDIEPSEETVESCCRAFPVVALLCVECDLRVTELDPQEVDAGMIDWDLAGDPGIAR